MQTELIQVTPSIAAIWLQANRENRPLRRQVVEGFKATLMRGEYVPTHQGIAFSEDGVLLDGQHRLTAIAEMPGGAFPMLVTKGLPAEAFKVLDIGARRNAADILKRDARIVAVANFYAAILVAQRASITPKFIEPIVERIDRHHSALCHFCPTAARMWSSAAVQAAAVYQMMRGLDEDYIKLTYRALVINDFKGMPPVAQMIYRSYINGTIRARDRYDAFLRMAKVFDSSCAELKVIKVIDAGKDISYVREFLMRELAVGRGEAPKKKAAPNGAAKSVLQANYRTTQH